MEINSVEYQEMLLEVGSAIGENLNEIHSPTGYILIVFSKENNNANEENNPKAKTQMVSNIKPTTGLFILDKLVNEMKSDPSIAKGGSQEAPVGKN